ncbi:MAG: efflux RND transporter periplasmic adaptor subunit [Phenylobacterium sp.]|nr:efflux RND transporter periplasmic adaptor subunit [Phenylobacterium sp.]
MSAFNLTRAQLTAGAAAVALIGALAGYGVAYLRPPTAGPVQEAGRKVLYWYDPMVPAQRFDKPGKSPFMDMQLVPRYADEASEAAGVRIDPAGLQSLGVRYATVRPAAFAEDLTAPGVLEFNGRDVAVVQARAAGFVQRVYGRAPGDVVGAGAPIADLLVPSWGGAQAEYLAVRRSGDAALEAAARQRLRLLGMPDAVIEAVARSGRPRSVVTVTTPVGGAIQTLDVRQGMTVSMGQTLAQVAGLGTVWMTAAVPEAQAGLIRPGASAGVELTAFPGETFSGHVSAVLPSAKADSRTLQARIELPNRVGRLRPGMYGTVHLDGPSRPGLVVPAEAVIRTGRRAIVMLALDGGRFQPVEVKTGREDAGLTEILAGLQDGQRIIASGQFLLDSEASLAGLQARPLAQAAAPHGANSASALHESRGRVEGLKDGQVTLSHEPVPAIGWPAMTMTFKLDPPGLAAGVKAGDQVAFGFEQRPDGPVVRRIAPAGARR